MSDAQPISRRRIIATAGVTACALPLAACAGTSNDSAAPSGRDTSKPSGGDATKSAGGHTALAKVSDIPIGSSVSAKTPDGKPLVIAHPAAGKIVAFSAVCTHMGCTVNPAGKELHCPCHGSKFDAATGKVLHGPASSPLPAYPVRVKGHEVTPKHA